MKTRADLARKSKLPYKERLALAQAKYPTKVKFNLGKTDSAGFIKAETT